MKNILLILTVLLIAPGLRAQGTIETVVTVTGHMLNEQTFTGVEVNYSVYESDGRKMGQTRRSNAVDGFLVTGLRPGSNYVFKIEDPRYYVMEYSIDIPRVTRYEEISKDFLVRPLELGKKLTLRPSPFDLKKATIRVGAEEEVLNQLAQTLMMNQSVHVEVVCYPDEAAAADQMERLSHGRGTTIKDFLVRKGVNAQRISVKAVNALDPLNPPPIRKGPKGKRYIGNVYIVTTKV